MNRYGLSCTASRDDNLKNAHIAVVSEWVRERGRLLASRFQEGENCEAVRAKAEAERVVDEFEAWQRNTAEADRRFRTHELEVEYEAALNRREEARVRLFGLPAPDNEALLFKVELLGSILDELEEEDATSLGMVVADARRLLSVGRA